MSWPPQPCVALNSADIRKEGGCALLRFAGEVQYRAVPAAAQSQDLLIPPGLVSEEKQTPDVLSSSDPGESLPLTVTPGGANPSCPFRWRLRFCFPRTTCRSTEQIQKAVFPWPAHTPAVKGPGFLSTKRKQDSKKRPLQKLTDMYGKWAAQHHCFHRSQPANTGFVSPYMESILCIRMFIEIIQCCKSTPLISCGLV